MRARAPGSPAVDMSAALKPLPFPDAVVATRASSPEPWQRGSLRSALHPQWLLSTVNGYRLPVEVVIDHDAVVDVGGVTLGHPRLVVDALTRRVVALAALNHATRRRFNDRGLLSLLYALDWHVRWRLSMGIGCNAGLERRHFDDYVRRLRGTGVACLVPIARRMADLAVAEAEAARTGFRADGSRWSKLDGERLAGSLGVTSDALLCNPSLRLDTTRRFGDLVDISPQGGRVGSGRPLSVRSVQKLLEPWHVLADMSARGFLPHDPLGFSPFDEGVNKIERVSERNGATGSRLAIAPPYFLALLDAAARWVLDYAPHLLHALATMRDDPDFRDAGRHGGKGTRARRIALSLALIERLPPDMPRLGLSWQPQTAAALGCDPPAIPMVRAVTHLMTACMVIVAGLGARSISDALALRVGCVTEPDPGAYDLALHQEEGIRDLDAMPVPLVVALAVRVLEELTADTRAATGDNQLFRFVRRPWAMSMEDPDRGVASGFPTKGYLTNFAAANGLPPADPETFAALTGDQLRLGFAVAYHHVAPGLPTEALTRALGQFNPMDTLSYVERSLPGAAARVAELVRARESTYRDAAGQAAIDELRSLLGDLRSRAEGFEAVRCDAALRLVRGIVDGVDLPGGAGGERLVLDVQAVVDRVSRRVRLGGRNHPEAERDELWSELRSFVRSHRIDVVPGRHAHCACRPGNAADLAKARCRDAAREALPWDDSLRADAAADRPDHAHAGMVPCLTCDHGAAFAADRAVVGAECARLAGGGGPAETGSARAARLARLAELRAVAAGAAPSGRRIAWATR